MGCDIHDYVEVRENGQWKKVGAVFPNPYHRPNEPEGEPDEDGYAWNAKKTDHPYKSRNYDLFAILANVRNGYGFAGVDTGNGFVRISEPKGLPSDVSPEVKAISDEYGGDGHSHSWLTLRELEAADWQRTTLHRGWVNVPSYKVFKEKGKPDSWSGGVGGGMVEHLTNKEMDARIESGTAHESCYTQVEWSETYATSVDGFLTETLPRLRELGGPDDVRMVFWFDN
jgi:hypothetical protein